MNMIGWLLFGSIAVNCALGIWQTIVIIRFERLLTNASDGAHNHFEAIRKVRQRGV
jgi:hypothetical protein